MTVSSERSGQTFDISSNANGRFLLQGTGEDESGAIGLEIQTENLEAVIHSPFGEATTAIADRGTTSFTVENKINVDLLK